MRILWIETEGFSNTIQDLIEPFECLDDFCMRCPYYTNLMAMPDNIINILEVIG
jgi:hypothetical protein